MATSSLGENIFQSQLFAFFPIVAACLSFCLMGMGFAYGVGWRLRRVRVRLAGVRLE